MFAKDLVMIQQKRSPLVPIWVMLTQRASKSLGLAHPSQYILTNREQSWRKARPSSRSHQGKQYQCRCTVKSCLFFFSCDCISTLSNEYANRKRRGNPGQEDWPAWEAVLIKCYISEASNWEFLRALVLSSFLFVTGTSIWQLSHSAS